MNRVTLRPGDYVATKGMTKAEYKAVEEAFGNAGCPRYTPEFGKGAGYVLVWDRDDTLISSNRNVSSDEYRHLTIDQVLNATNAGNPWRPHDGGECPVERGTLVDVELRGGGINQNCKIGESGCGATRWEHHGDKRDIISWRYHETARQGGINHDSPNTIERLRTALERKQAAEADYRAALEGVRAELGSDFELTEVGADGALVDGEDMSDPANWRKGDVVECKIEEYQGFDKGGLYKINAIMWAKILITSNNGIEQWRASQGFRFHHRPGA